MTNIGEPTRVVLGVTGASGAAYARRLIECMIDADVELHLVVSPYGRQLFNDELQMNEVNDLTLLGRREPRLVIHPYKALGSSIASGSLQTAGMVICPCSSNTLGQIASGLGDSLLTRAAQVTLKERRRLILVPREAPLNHLDLENCLRLSHAGAIICPASPGFYMLPKSIDDLVDFMVGKIMDLLAVPHALNTRWADMIERGQEDSGERE